LKYLSKRLILDGCWGVEVFGVAQKKHPRKTGTSYLAPIAAVMLWSLAEQHLSGKRDPKYLRVQMFCFKKIT